MSWAKRLVRGVLGGTVFSGSRGKVAKAPRSRRVAVEPLEDRRLLSVGGTYDFGDLPDNYGTTLAADGARHEAIGPTLGTLRDTEADGLPTVAADGDGANEDGVTFGEIRVGQLDAQVTVNVQNAPDGAKLDAWIDFNGDGSFGGAGERIAGSVAVSEGDNVVEFDVPSWAVSGEAYARFRVSSEGDMGPKGMASDGEVEDHRVTISPAVSGNLAGVARPVFGTTASPWCVAAADMNRDGHVDILAASYHGHEISWYENDGNENFTEHTISSSANGATSIVVADMDNDGDLDVVAALEWRNAIVWYENDGSTHFTEHTISRYPQAPRSVFAVDLNGDGHTDVLSTTVGEDKIVWYENNGNGSFTGHAIANSADAAYCVFASDFNGDGQVDVLAGLSGTRIAWYENDGAEGFMEHVISTSGAALSVVGADIDGDGDMDVVSSFAEGKAVWYANDGSGKFTERGISSAGDATSVFAADLNGDGHVDIVSVSYGSPRVVWHENDGSGFFIEHTISTTIQHARHVVAADVNGDGCADVISAAGVGSFVHLPNTISWYENDGSGHFADHPLTVHPGSSVEAADLNGDGRVDIIAQANTQLVWREYDESGRFTTHIIDELGLDHYRPGHLSAVDVNGDGYTDVLSSSYDFLNDTTLTWYENDGDGTFLRHEISFVESYWSGFKSIFGADVDGDGHLDIVSVLWNENNGEQNQIVWYENDGSEHFTEHSFPISLSRPGYVVPADLNGDGHIDLVCSADPDNWSDDNLAWYENDGHGVFTERIIDAPWNTRGVFSIVASDVNEDGHMDFLAGGARLSWYENDGHGSFTRHSVSDVGYTIQPGMAVDVNGDGHMDVLSIARGLNDMEVTVLWHENDGTGTFVEHVLTEPYGNEVTAGDIDGDGNLDILTASTWYNMWAIDFGDAPDSYGTTLASDGARHDALGPRLGATRDAEVDGLASVGAEADDARPSDDENGVILLNSVFAGQTEVTATVNVQEVPAGAKLDAWIDFDGDGTFDPADRIADSIDVTEGDNVIFFNVPDSAAIGQTYARFRLSSQGNLGPTGSADDGEVEDYAITISPHLLDFGDAPDTYGTALAADGARHEPAGPTLGWNRDAEEDGHPTDGADGDDNTDQPDEYGVRVGLVMPGQVGAVVTVPVQDAPNGAKLDAWIDFDGNGTFDGGDQIADSVDVVDGENVIRFDVPESAVAGQTYARFRLSSAGNLEPTGSAFDGEVEDYLVTIYPETAPVDLGVVDYVELPPFDPSTDPKVYTFTTKYAGYLTVLADEVSATGSLMVHLFDESGNLVGDTSTSTGDDTRVELLDLTAGKRYTLHVSGPESEVDLEIINLVEQVDGAVTVHGTDAADEFYYLASSTHRVLLNGLRYDLDPAAIGSIHFAGGAGEDYVSMTGSAGDETAILRTDGGSMTRTATGFTVSAEDLVRIAAHGGGGNDMVEMIDGEGDDVFYIWAHRALLQSPIEYGAVSPIKADDFRSIHVYAKNGGNDRAKFQGTDDAERVKVYPEMVKMTKSDYFTRAKFFEHVEVDTELGVDTAIVTGSDGADVVWASSYATRVAYDVALAEGERPDLHPTAYGVSVTGTERVVARGRGTDDWLELHDSPVDDVLIAKPHRVDLMNGPRAEEGVERGAEYWITARGYGHVTAIADSVGDDTAKLYDSGEEGVDIWAAGYVDGETWSTMTSPSRQLYEVLAFEHVGGYGFNGGLGEDHGVNRKDHADDVDFVFQYGYWEGDEEPGPSNPRNPRGR